MTRRGWFASVLALPLLRLRVRRVIVVPDAITKQWLQAEYGPELAKAGYTKIVIRSDYRRV